MRISDCSSDVCSSDLPRALQGDFLTAAFQHPTLGPHGTPEDTTVVYVVTRGHGLAQSLLPAIQRFDPAVHLPHLTQEEHGDGHAQYRPSEVADDPGGATGTFCGSPPAIRQRYATFWRCGFGQSFPSRRVAGAWYRRSTHPPTR